MKVWILFIYLLNAPNGDVVQVHTQEFANFQSCAEAAASVFADLGTRAATSCKAKKYPGKV